MKLDAVQASDVGVRRAALLLHGMEPSDRIWLLDQLPVKQQELLSGLLVELAELGLPADPEFVRQAVASSSTVPMPMLTRLDREQIDSLTELLRHEPAVVVAHLMAAQPWTWGSSVMQSMDSSRREKVEACMSRVDVSSRHERLREAVVDAVVEQLRASAKGSG